MSAADRFLQQWYFHVPDRLMFALMCVLAVQFLLALALGTFNRDAIPLRILAAITTPVIKPIRFLTPRIVPSVLLPVSAIAVLMVLRMLLYMVCAALGVRPVL